MDQQVVPERGHSDSPPGRKAQCSDGSLVRERHQGEQDQKACTNRPYIRLQPR